MTLVVWGLYMREFLGSLQYWGGGCLSCVVGLGLIELLHCEMPRIKVGDVFEVSA